MSRTPESSALSHTIHRLANVLRGTRKRNQRRRNVSPQTIESLEIRQLLSADFQLLRDLDAIPHSSNPERFVTVGAVMFFKANGSELWKSDGTEAGTVLVKTMSASHDSTWLGESINGNGVLYFSANAGVNGLGIWKSDGTEAGTLLVKPAPTTLSGALPTNLSFVNGLLYFTTTDDQQQKSLWKSDGTTSGTAIVRDISTTAANISIGQTTASVTIGNSLLFTVNNATTGVELWRSDGTASGTGLLKDIQPGASGSDPSAMVAFNSAKYFSANDGAHGKELWKTDGTAIGTVLVKDIVPGTVGSDPQNLTVINGSLYFTTIDNSGKFSLWKSDGTSSGTVEVKQFSQAGISGLGELTEVNGTLFFALRFASNDELWKTDGTAAGTGRVKSIAGARDFREFTNVNGKLYFIVSQFERYTEIWHSDGTEPGTSLVRDSIYSTPTELTNVNGRLLFSSAIEFQFGRELWRLINSEEPVLVKDIDPQIDARSTSSNPQQFTVANGIEFFVTGNAFQTNILWKTNGRPGGTKILTPYGSAPNPDWLTEVNGRLYFSSTQGNSIWSSDGTLAGTKLVKSLTPNSFSRNPFNLINANGTLMFVADNGTHGFELWKSDGTESGTVMVTDINSGANSSSPRELVNANGVLYFRASSPDHGLSLWRSDGTASGTVVVREHAFSGIYGGSMANIGGTLFFTGFDGSNGVELWKSDGTETGTILLSDTLEGNSSGYPNTLVNHNGTLFFLTRDSSTLAPRLWNSDGTPDGTKPVQSVQAGTISQQSGMMSAGNFTYFISTVSDSGQELWRTDGTDAGTKMVKDIVPGTGSSFPKLLANIDGLLYFNTDDGVHGRELWKSDGTESGTTMVFDFTGDLTDSNPSEVALLGDRLIVAASTAQTGNELFVNFDPNKAPTSLSLTGTSLPENSALQTNVGTFSTIDPDTGDTHTYSLAEGPGDTDNAKFAIAGNKLQTAANLNFEEKSSYSIRVRTTDQGEKFKEKTFTVTVTNVNDSPSAVRLQNQLAGIAEFISTASAIKIGDVAFDDDSLGSNTLSISGADAAYVSLVGKQVFLKAGTVLNRTTKPTYKFTINVDDPTVGSSVDASLNVELPVTRNWTTITGPAAVSTMQRPTITWTPVGGATKYYVWIRNASTNVQDYLVTTSRTTSFTPGSDLGIGKFVVWVRPVGSKDEKGSWSSRYEFQVTAPPSFLPMSSQNATSRPTLQWNSLRGAITTDLWIANLSTGQREAVRVANVQGTSWTPPTDLPMGSYRAWIRGMDAAKNAGQWSVPLDFLVLPAVAQIAPVGVTELRPEFRWNAVQGATGYKLVVTDAVTNAIVLNQQISTGTIFVPPNELSAGRYTWSVFATLRGGAQSATATSTSFVAGNTPTLLTPSGATSQRTPQFSWTVLDGATKYRLLVKDTRELSPLLIDVSSLTTTNHTPTQALPVGHYRAWIQAFATAGTWSPLSKPLDFTIV